MFTVQRHSWRVRDAELAAVGHGGGQGAQPLGRQLQLRCARWRIRQHSNGGAVCIPGTAVTLCVRCAGRWTTRLQRSCRVGSKQDCSPLPSAARTASLQMCAPPAAALRPRPPAPAMSRAQSSVSARDVLPHWNDLKPEGKGQSEHDRQVLVHE